MSRNGLPAAPSPPHDAGPADRTDAQSVTGRFSAVQELMMAPFSRAQRRSDSARILSDLAPAIMTPKMITAATSSQLHRQRTTASESSRAIRNLDFATLGRAPMRLTLGSRRLTSRDLQIVEATSELLDAEIPEPQGVASNVSLLRGFQATIPSSEKNKSRRRKTRNIDAPHMGLKELGMSARGLLRDEAEYTKDSEHDVTAPDRAKKPKRKAKELLSASVMLGKEELVRQKAEVILDKENIAVRRALINAEIEEITYKITALDAIRNQLEQDLLRLHEEELELDDELEGIQERTALEDPPYSSVPTTSSRNPRRRKGPAFLPSEHDDLPPGIAFMSLARHTAPITALDFSEPYGMLVSAAQDDTTRCWDLCTGDEIGRLSGHSGMVKCVQIEDNVCVTGGADSTIRIWDLRQIGEEDQSQPILGDIPELVDYPDNRSSQPEGSSLADESSCLRVLEGHSKAVSTIYYEGNCLVSGACDKTIRQWDMSTGQCVLTMDILWAISHPPAIPQPSTFFTQEQVYGGSPPMTVSSANFAVPTPPLSDGSWEMYQDFVGAVQFWGYALVSGSGDGVVRMWDMRTGQAHRTLVGHTGPVTSLQFDELHVVSGSLDKSLRIWDIRTGGISETIRYDFPVTALQFDSRKVVAASGENGIKIYNRTTMQQSTLTTNGHTRPVERLRYMDRYLVSGARDHTVKVWSL